MNKVVYSPVSIPGRVIGDAMRFRAVKDETKVKLTWKNKP
jgi:hypothetical protein